MYKRPLNKSITRRIRKQLKMLARSNVVAAHDGDYKDHAVIWWSQLQEAVANRFGYSRRADYIGSPVYRIDAYSCPRHAGEMIAVAMSGKWWYR